SRLFFSSALCAITACDVFCMCIQWLAELRSFSVLFGLIRPTLTMARFGKRPTQYLAVLNRRSSPWGWPRYSRLASSLDRPTWIVPCLSTPVHYYAEGLGIRESVSIRPAGGPVEVPSAFQLR